MIEPVKIENGVTTFQAWSRSKMGAMCSDREALYKLESKEIGENKWLTITSTFERPDVPCDPNCVRMQYFKASQTEMIGEDLHNVEF